MTGSTFGVTITTTIPPKVTAAINQLLANQMAIMQQMAAMSFSPQPLIAAAAFNVPPIQNVTFPAQQAFLDSVFNPGTGAMYGRGQRRGISCGRCGGQGGQRCNHFANLMINLVRGMGQQLQHSGGFPGAALPGNLPLPQQGMQRGGLCHSNIYKWYNNWDICFSCGFYMEDGHTSLTCPFRFPEGKSPNRIYSGECAAFHSGGV